MILQELLINFIPSKDVKQRLKNKQIKVNNISVENLKIDLPITDSFLDIEDFMWWGNS